MSVVASIQHYQKSIEKCQGDRTRILHCINRLYDLPVTVQHLQDTGVGRTINSLRKSEGKIGDAARALVAKWKQMVEEEDNETEAQTVEEPHKRHHEEPDFEESKRHKDRYDKRDKYKSESQAGSSSHERENFNDSYKENRKRKKADDRNHSREKRQHVESEDECVEDEGHLVNTVDSDSEDLQIEEKVNDARDMGDQYLQEHSNYECENDELPSDNDDKVPLRIKSGRMSSDEFQAQFSDDEYATSVKTRKSPSPSFQKESKYQERENYNYHSHDKSNKKDRHSSDSKYKRKSSSQNPSKIKSESSPEPNYSHDIDSGKNGSYSSSSSKSKDKHLCSSSSSKSENKGKDKNRESCTFDIKKVKSEFLHDGVDVKKVKLEPQEKDNKSLGSSRYKEDKRLSESSETAKKTVSEVNMKSESKSKHRDKDRKERHQDKQNDKDDRKSKEKKREKDRKRSSELYEDGVDSFSGTSFAEALGMCIPEKTKKKSSLGSTTGSPSTSKSQKPFSNVLDNKACAKDTITSPNELEQQCASIPLEPLDVDEDFGLPALNPNYKPLPQPSYNHSPSKKLMSEDEALTNIMYSKVQRTKVFSGNKTGYTSVPSLFDLCIRVLQENIDALEFTGGVPFDLLKPVLERATADQLFTLEDYNAYLIEDTDTLWEFHCKKDFRNKKREELETWREMYMRCREERERKLKALTFNIAAANKAKALPVRKTQLAYVEGTVKPPRNIARKQAKFGTANVLATPLTAKQPSSDSPGLSTSFTGRSTTSTEEGPLVSVPTPRGSAGAGAQQSGSCKPKPKAPLMQKALQLIKYNRFKR